MRGENGVNGYLHQPMLFERLDLSNRIAQEEIFGPVLQCFRGAALTTWSTTAEVSYGLTASMWTRDISVAHAVENRL